MAELDPIQAQLTALRRHQILDAATQVFAAKGFHRATIKDVAKAAGVADGTIYNYFENKSALILGILDRLNETPQREEHFDQASQMDIEEWTRLYIKQRYRVVGQEGLNVFQVVLAEALVNPELRDLYMQQVVEPTFELGERYFRQWAQQRSIKAVNPALAQRVVAGMFLGAIMLRLLGDRELLEHWDELPDVIAEIIINGLKENSDE